MDNNKNLDPKVREYFSFLGKKGGSVKSFAKAEACKLNGMKGGRPKKSQKDSVDSEQPE